MPTIRSRPQIEAVSIPGPSGPLEGIVNIPAHAKAAQVAVICHPHPVYGGTMTNKVVHTLARAFNDFGLIAVRFNFRGVGASAGHYDEGNGETDDAVAVMDWAAQRWPGSQTWLGGFSFGGAVAIRAAVARGAQRLVTVAPGIKNVAIDTGRLPEGDWLLVQGDNDELVNARDVQDWASALSSPPQIVLLPGADHFFHGRLNDLRAVVVEWLNGIQAPSQGTSAG